MTRVAQRSLVTAYPHFWLCLAHRLRSDAYPNAPIFQSGANWVKFPLGRSSYYLHAAILSRTAEFRIGLTLQHQLAGEWFEKLRKLRADAETDFGGPLEWQEKAESQRCMISAMLAEVDVSDATTWDGIFDWASPGIARLDRTFRSRMGVICQTITGTT